MSDSDELDPIRQSWRDVDPDGETDPATLAIVATLRRAWQDMPIPAVASAARPRVRPASIRRVAAISALAAGLVAAATSLFVSRPPATSAHQDSIAVARPNASRAPASRGGESRLVADLTLVVLGNTSPLALWPVACLCCEALMLVDPSRLALPPSRGEADDLINAAIAADCRGDWSLATRLLEPLVERETLGAEQHIRANATLSHAYRQLGRVDEAQRVENMLAMGGPRH